jgi:GH15 family glucan-1,4-alpha-glucosidase
MSIWEVRSRKQNYVYSKIMLWVAFDRGLRLAEKRCLPCPNRAKWLAVRDEIYENIMTAGVCLSFIPTLCANAFKVIARTSDASFKAMRAETILTPLS